MKKKIVICSDGTGNRGGYGNDSNVWRIYTAAAGKEADMQFAIYDDGIGTEYVWLRNFVDRMLGIGMGKNIKELYLALCHVYEPGSDIYLFGFSRGAHTVRRLAGFISSQGILNPARYKNDRELHMDIDKLFTGYRLRGATNRDNSLECIVNNWCYKIWGKLKRNTGTSSKSYIDRVRAEARIIHRKKRHFQANRSEYWDGYHPDTISYLQQTVPKNDIDTLQENRVGIRFMGVWDTVDAVGFPVDWAAEFWNEYIYRFQFRDYRVSPFVSCALHALAIDECRKSFKPRLIDTGMEDSSNSGDKAETQNAGSSWDRVSQIWFAGVHSNIGGGYPKQGLAHISLCWIAEAAKFHGLIVDDDVIMTINDNQMLTKSNKLYATLTNAHDKLYNPRKGIWGFYAYQHRNIEELHTLYCGSGRPVVDSTVLARIARRTQSYSPFNLPAEFEYIDSCGTKPCGFFRGADVQDIISREWASVDAKHLERIVRGSERWCRLLALSKVITIVAVFIMAVFACFGLYDRLNGQLTPLAYCVGLTIGLLALHYLIDTVCSRLLAAEASDIWSGCIYKVHRIVAETQDAG